MKKNEKVSGKKGNVMLLFLDYVIIISYGNLIVIMQMRKENRMQNKKQIESAVFFSLDHHLI